jgi:hypothetical protein
MKPTTWETKRRWKDDIKIDLVEVGYEGVVYSCGLAKYGIGHFNMAMRVRIRSRPPEGLLASQ